MIFFLLMGIHPICRAELIKGIYLPEDSLKNHRLVKDSLELIFRDPPAIHQPYVWWHWMGPNFSEEGITKDLEAMKDAGIGGATIFNLTSAVQESHAPTLKNPWPDKTYRGPEYWKAIRFAASEAQRLGLEIGLHNTVGYSTTGGPWIDEKRSMQRLIWSDTIINGSDKGFITLKNPVLAADEGWGRTGRKLSFFKDITVLAVPADKSLIDTTEIINLTAYYNTKNGLRWNPRPGKWKIYRICHASTGRPPHPVPDDVIGKTLEADKMSTEQSIYHWNSLMAPVQQHLGEYLGKSFKHMLIDSYEAGYQNWTPNFRSEFQKIKGYDPLLWIVSMGQPVTGDENSKKPLRIIVNEELTKRFEWDYYDVINHLFFENGFKIGKEILAKNKLLLQFEPYGGTFNTSQGAALADLPMGEFWTYSSGEINSIIPATARSTGKKVVGAEAFTGWPTNSMYTEDPAYLKKSADGSFASGVNRLILHHWVHQPFDDKYLPGMSMGWWGTHFGRNQTWFEPGKSFFKYLGRCQTMLQQGEQVADYLCFEKMVGFSDVISKNEFLTLKISVEDNRIILPSGRNYPFMVFSDSLMLPEVAIKIKELVASGAIIISPKPLRSHSLKNYPECDNIIRQIGEEVWGQKNHNIYGKGKVFTSLKDAVNASGITPDYIIRNASSPDKIKVVHRSSPKADIYFVANTYEKPQHVRLSLRISGKQPEIWQAEDGSIHEANVWNNIADRTEVDLNLKGSQSVFVVFRNPVKKYVHPVSVEIKDTLIEWSILPANKEKTIIVSSKPAMAKVGYSSGEVKNVQIPSGFVKEISGNWLVSFCPKADSCFNMEFPELIDFSRHPDKAVNYFAGTATYSLQFNVDNVSSTDYKQVVLDLGELNDIAEVKLNGRNIGVIWYPPYKTDVTNFIKPGVNNLEIAVTNNWANRMIGDEQEPADFEWGLDRGAEFGRAMLAYPEWFLKNQPRPSKGRKTFSVWYYYRSDSKLQPAGLVGPVKLIFEKGIKL